MQREALCILETVPVVEESQPPPPPRKRIKQDFCQRRPVMRLPPSLWTKHRWRLRPLAPPLLLPAATILTIRYRIFPARNPVERNLP